MSRTEFITRGDCPPAAELAPGVELRLLVSGRLGAERLSSGTATFRPGAILPYHSHPCSEAITVLSGEAEIIVEARCYRVGPYDAMHVPAGIAHQVRNFSRETPAVLHSAFASAEPARELVVDRFVVTDSRDAGPDRPERLTAFKSAPVYELAPQAFFRDLFARRFGSRGICGGYGVFQPGASLPCHFHGFDESITIVTGTAICRVAGREHELSNCDTACVPRGLPHRFINRSAAPMAMIWVYAGDEPDRTIVDQGYCAGTLPIESLRTHS
jgi:quercetin dioxygenase-like cupin family protein